MTKIIFAAAACAALMSGSAMAEQVQTAFVSAKGVDFNDRAQVQALYAKIEAAARQACSLNSPNPALAAPEQDCVRSALADTVQRLDRPVLTAVYDRAATQRALATNDQ